MPSLVLVHDKLGGSSGMGRVAAFAARAALHAGWDVTLVCGDAERDLLDRCTVQRVRAVRRLPGLAQYLPWYAAAARRVRHVKGDVVHVHAPAHLEIGDVMTCHHLAAPAAERGVRDHRGGLPGAGRRLEQRLAMQLDDRWYRSRPARTRLTFVSEFLRNEFLNRYGAPLDGAVIAPPSPPWDEIRPAQRVAARARYALSEEDALVVGYLGGDDQRKGVQFVGELDRAPDMQLLVAGPGSETLQWKQSRSVGYVDVHDFTAACDVIVAPTLFDASPTAVTQALARGVPVVVGAASGWAPEVEREKAGVVWDQSRSLAECVRAAAQLPTGGCRRMTLNHSADREAARLIAAYERAAGSSEA